MKGPKGEERVLPLPFIEVREEQGGLLVRSRGEGKQARANLGTMCALLKNAIEGVTSGFSKVLEIEGVGFRAALEGETVVLSLGFVNPVRFDPPQGVKLTVEKNTITVSGTNRALVGQVAAVIRAFRKPEPYKGKGIRYQGEVIRRKVGKKAGVVKTG